MAISLAVTTQEDLLRIKTWASVDLWHKNQNYPEWWKTGEGYLSFCVRDEEGPIFYSRIDQEQEWFRLHCQFGPRPEVSRERVVAGVTACLQVLPSYLALSGRGMRFDSENSSLIKFLEARDFKKSEIGDYVIEFGLKEN